MYINLKMLKKPLSLLLNIFLILFFTISYTIAEIVNKIEIKGNKRIANETIIMFTKVQLGDNLNENSLNIILKNLYGTNFFKDVSVRLEKNALLISVEENPLVENIVYNGIKSKTLKEKLTQNLKLKSRSSFSQILLKQDRDSIISSLKDTGYYFSKVEVAILELGNNKIDLVFEIDLGDKAKIKKISLLVTKFIKTEN